jgi:hypothetical protein
MEVGAMSYEDAIVAAGTALIIAVLVLVAYLMGFRRLVHLDHDALAAELAAAEPRARLQDAVFSANGRAALARLQDGKLLVARVMADGVSMRTLGAEAARISLRKDRARVAFADLGFPPLELRLAEAAPDWLRGAAGETA